ncbi:MAG TPA: histidine phosphatase family protein [Stellaceae bacterium]|nr:histidine phosphatase family protein [Stellaceae bacterium]
MTSLALLRHGPTRWSREHRLQGRADLGLDEAGRAALGLWRLPPEMTARRWLVSPLARARETAALLGLTVEIEPRLIEMDWGAWEGRQAQELRASEPGFAADEARGLDLSPPGGESPRTVQVRLLPLLAELAAKPVPVGAVTHKGVIRAVLALATGWDMRGKAPARLRWDAVHLFELGPAGRPRIERLNLSLVAP